MNYITKVLTGNKINSVPTYEKKIKQIFMKYKADFAFLVITTKLIITTANYYHTVY